MNRLLTFLCLVVALSCSAASWAQMRGHEYYCWEASLGKDIPCEIRLEHDGDQLILGEIRYLRSGGKTSAIRLYGDMARMDGGWGVTLYEFLASGKQTGRLSLHLTADGQPEGGVWSTPDGSRSYPINVTRSKPFPYAEVPTYFHSTSTRSATGVYLCQSPDVTLSRLELSLTSDYGGRRWYNLHFADSDVPTPASHLYYSHPISMTRHVVDSYKYLPGADFYAEMRTFDDFVYIGVILDTVDEYNQTGRPGRFYIRQHDEKVFNTLTYVDDIQFATRSRLKDGKVQVYVNPSAVAALSEIEEDEIEPMSGWTDLHDVTDSPVKDILVADLGDDINPVLAILHDDGTVQALTLLRSAARGRLSVSGPLYGMNDIQSLSSMAPIVETDFFSELGDGDVEVSIMYGLDRQGERHDIEICYTSGDWTMETKADGGRTKVEEWISLSPEWAFQYNRTTTDASGKTKIINYYGTFHYKDSDREEIVYTITESVDLDDRNPAAESDSSQPLYLSKPCHLEGSFKVSEDYEVAEGGVILVITPLTGFTFDIPKGKSARFTYMHLKG